MNSIIATSILSVVCRPFSVFSGVFLLLKMGERNLSLHKLC